MEEFKGTKWSVEERYNPDHKQKTFNLDNDHEENAVTVWAGFDEPKALRYATIICEAFNVVTRTGLTPEQMEKEIKALKTTIGAYKVLQSNHDLKVSHYSKKAQDIDNAIQSLESERKMNEILTNEKEDLEARLKEAEEKSIKYDSLKQHCDIISGELNWEREVVVKDLDQRLIEAVELILELKTAVYSYEKRSWEEAGANENELEKLLSTSPLIVKSDSFLTKEKTK